MTAKVRSVEVTVRFEKGHTRKFRLDGTHVKCTLHQDYREIDLMAREGDPIVNVIAAGDLTWVD